MTTSWWMASEKVQTYSSLGNPLEWQFAYPELFKRLDFGLPVEGPVLDYGCGPGKVAAHISATYGYDVVGCDVSAEMIAIADKENATSGTNFVRLAEPRLEGYTDGHFGAAVCCFVLCVIGYREQHFAIAREVRRLLRPGAPFGVIVPHPDSVGVQFSTCRSGAPGVAYSDGDPMTTQLTANGNELTIHDFYWSADWYRNLLKATGFTDVQAHSPLPKQLGEPEHAPFLVVTGRC